jgi:hypothetical protein
MRIHPIDPAAGRSRRRNPSHAPRQTLTYPRPHIVLPPNAAAGAHAPIVVGRCLEDVYCLDNVRHRILRSR